MEVLAPAVQDGSDADVGAEVLGLGRDGGERLGRGRKQQSIDLGLVLVGDRADCGWQREHHVEVRHRQQFGFARRKPRLGGRPLALGAVPVAARVIGDACVGAVLTALDMAAQRRRAANLDRGHHAPLAEAQTSFVVSTPSGTVAVENVRHFELWMGHRRRINPALSSPCSGTRAGSEPAGSS